jgi:hypothetical protein
VTKLTCPTCGKTVGEIQGDVLIYQHHGHTIAQSVTELVRKVWGSEVATALQTIVALVEKRGENGKSN